MIRVQELARRIPYYRPVPLTRLPLIYHREHLFPYTSHGDTEAAPVDQVWNMIVLENDFLRIEVAPELGGRVYSLFDKRIGREILFSNPVVKPVRILPIWAFISGGIEFNFPIAHSPTSISAVACRTGRSGDYGFVRVGEREARTGMEWVVELGLLENQPVLVQRTALRNCTARDHPWMMWTIGAVRSTEQTEFVHPKHRVLVHDDRLTEADWPGEGLNWDRSYHQMTALFWKPGSAPQFGAFHHDLGFGLMHLADPARLPGKKVWTYGHGRHRGWGQATTEGGLCYAEIESGPLLDQAEKPLFPRGQELRFEEYWVPVHSRDAFEKASIPQLALPPWEDPWLGWHHSAWQTEWERFRAHDGPLPQSMVATGLELEEALRRECEAQHPRAGEAAACSAGFSLSNRKNRDQTASEALALWLAFHGRPQEALPLVQNDARPSAQRIAGLIQWKALHEPQRAILHLEKGPLRDPVATVELDELYAEAGLTERRTELLARAPDHRLILERRADLALVTGQPEETLRLLESRSWPREHQRYVRTQLWQKARHALGEPEAAAPDSLNEDNLATYGAYWSDR